MSRLEQLSALLLDAPNDPFLLFAIAKTHEKAGDDLQALDWYNQLLQHHPADVGQYYHLGKLHERQQNVELARAIYAQGIDIAKSLGDRHAQSELEGAAWEIEA